MQHHIRYAQNWGVDGGEASPLPAPVPPPSPCLPIPSHAKFFSFPPSLFLPIFLQFPSFRHFAFLFSFIFLPHLLLSPFIFPPFYPIRPYYFRFSRFREKGANVFITALVVWTSSTIIYDCCGDQVDEWWWFVSLWRVLWKEVTFSLFKKKWQMWISRVHSKNTWIQAIFSKCILFCNTDVKMTKSDRPE